MKKGSTADYVKEIVENLPDYYVADITYDEYDRIEKYTNAVTNVTYSYEYVMINDIDYVSVINTPFGIWKYVYDKDANIVAFRTPWTVTIGAPTVLNIASYELTENIADYELTEVYRVTIPEAVAYSYMSLSADDVRFILGEHFDKYNDDFHVMKLDFINDEYVIVIYTCYQK